MSVGEGFDQVDSRTEAKTKVPRSCVPGLRPGFQARIATLMAR